MYCTRVSSTCVVLQCVLHVLYQGVQQYTGCTTVSITRVVPGCAAVHSACTTVCTVVLSYPGGWNEVVGDKVNHRVSSRTGCDGASQMSVAMATKQTAHIKITRA